MARLEAGLKLKILYDLQRLDWATSLGDHWDLAAEILDGYGVDSGFNQDGEQWLKGDGVFASEGYTGLVFKKHRTQELIDELEEVTGRPGPGDGDHPLTNASYSRGVDELRRELQDQIDELRVHTDQNRTTADLAKVGLGVAILALLVAVASSAYQFLA